MFTYVEWNAENREADQRLTFAMLSYVQLRATVKICSVFVPLPSPDAGLTRRCVIGPSGISLTAANTTEIELKRSGPNGLQGKGTPPFAVAQQAPGLSGGKLHLNRVQ